MSERPRVDFEDLGCREATREDESNLHAISCGSERYQREVEQFLRNEALARHVNRAHAQHHRLLLFESTSGGVIGAAAHRPEEIPFPPGTEGREAGTRLVFLAVDRSYHRHDLSSGASLARRAMEMFLADAAEQSTRRLVSATVHIGNAPSLGLCARFGLDPVQQRGDYVQLLGSFDAR